MLFSLQFEMNNEAFADDAAAEAARILRAIARCLEQHGPRVAGTIRDVNGNTVGYWSVDNV